MRIVNNFNKIFIYIVLIILIILFNLNLDPNISFYGDNGTKFFQAYAVINNQFKDDVIRCQWLSEFEFCKYALKATTMYNVDEYTLRGVFPVALSYFNAIIIYLLGKEYFLVIPQIIFFINLLMFYRYLDSFFLIALFLFTPLFFQYLSFSDLALSLFFSSFVYIFLDKRDSLSKRKTFLLGTITGLNVFFRYETQIFIFVLLFLLYLMDKENRKKYLIFSFGVLFSLLVFFIVNFIYYGNIIGIRFEANKQGIFNINVKEKLFSIWGNLWGTWTHPVGHFKYMFYLLIFYILFFINRKKFPLLDSVIYFSILISLMIILVLVPNDSGADFGTRYLSVLIYPSFLLINNFYKIYENKIIQYMIIFVMFIALFFTVKFFNELQKVNHFYRDIYLSLNDNAKKNSLWIFHSNFGSGGLGAYLIDNTAIVLEHEYEVDEFIKTFEAHSLEKKYKNLVIFHFRFNFYLPEEINQKDRYFYEDERVREKLLKFIQKKYVNSVSKKVIIKDKEDINIYYFY